MCVQTQATSHFAPEPPERHKIQWVSLVIGLTTLAFIGGAAYLFHTAAGGVEVHSSPHTSLATAPSKSDEQAPKAAYILDHSVVNRQNLPTEPNPAPMAIAAYE
jgi:hypothetical protein